MRKYQRVQPAPAPEPEPEPEPNEPGGIYTISGIDHVVYINLDKRDDRRQQVQQELEKVFPADKITRFAAIYNIRGGIGCYKSHIAVLELAKANGWANVLVAEDDFVWKNLGATVPTIERLLENPYDAIVLGGSYATYDKVTMRLAGCQSTVGYIVNRAYYDTLLDNFKEGLPLLEQTGNYSKYSLDVQWKKAQSAGLWYIVRAAGQRPSYSDIENKHMNYLNVFN